MPNPLCALAHPIPFDQIRAEHIEPALRELVEQARQQIERIGGLGEPPTWDNTLGALESATEALEVASSVVEHLEWCATNQDIRASYNATLPLTTAFFSGIALDAALYARLRAFAATPEARTIDATRQRYLTKTLDEFRRQGAELDGPHKQRFAAIEEELSRATATFAQHVLDATNAYECVVSDESRLLGLPESARLEAKESAERRGLSGWRFTLHAPSLTAVLTHAADASLRRELWEANDDRCRAGAFDNRQLLYEILRLRREKASLLGQRDFADWVMADRMAKDGRTAQTFVDELTQLTESAYVRETGELLEFKRVEVADPTAQLLPWDLAYYAERLRERRFDFDEEQLRAFFPAERMLQGMFCVASELFGIRITAAPELPSWHESVRGYLMNDEDGRCLGAFYVDLYPRDSKSSGAWMHGLLSGNPNVAVIAANASPPAGGRPSLLSHRDVETLWHEFGHLLHHCLSEVKVRGLSGTRVVHDFVELPSQLMENWCWEPSVLFRFARHWQSGEAIPESLVRRLREARTFRAATAQMRQLGFAALDLALHREYEPQRDGDVLAFARRVQQRFSPAVLPDSYAMVATFSHLFSRPVGYAAGYYSYKWAEVLDADAFGRFIEEGVLNPQVGRAWRQTVLAQGDARDPTELFIAFRGRPAQPQALLERLGLAEPQGSLRVGSE